MNRNSICAVSLVLLLGIGAVGASTAVTATQDGVPTAAFTYSPSDPAVDETVTFDASGSTDDARIEEYEWDLDGDGYYSYDGEIVTESFSEAGTYTVSLRVTDEDGHTDTVTETVRVTNDPPAPEFDYSPSDPVVDETITFDGSPSSDADGNVVEYEWDLDGDGYYSYDGSSVTRSFDEAGTYTVSLRVTDNAGEARKTTKTIEVTNEAPTAEFDYSPGEPSPDETITFDGSPSSDADGNIVEYEWDLDGDGYYSYDGSRNTYSFDEAGTYTVSLRVTDNGGVTTKETKSIQVTNEPPNATFSYSPGEPSPDETITFDARNASDPDGTIEEYEWDLDNDGYFSYDGSQASTDFDTAGTYPVTLRVTDNGGRTVERTERIRVTNEPPNATFAVSSDNPDVGESITFDASESVDVDGTIEEYEWDFDGDGRYSYDGSVNTYSFDENGTHTVTLRVTDNGDRTVEVSRVIPVGDVETADGETPDDRLKSTSHSFARGDLFQVARLYATETEIEPGNPGQLAGAFTAEVTNDQPVKVQLTMQVPSGIRIEGAKDIESGGGGLVSGTFVVDPGETKDISARVVGDDPGAYRLRADITYFPVGDSENASEQDDLRLDFEVRDDAQEAAIQDETDSDAGEGESDASGGEDDAESDADSPGFTPVTAVAALLAAAALGVRARR